ncbi:MAG TPA: hypothetical protein EYP85_00470 [Armatimonadetes bacterium]|nr:hypothetical protein [Armatimonadota bacterium]
MRFGGRGRGIGWSPRAGWGRGIYGGWGNPYPYCRFYPWLPRRWWAYGTVPYGYTGYPHAPRMWPVRPYGGNWW